MDIPPLDTFGRRIMVCGPSNSGKSTLAVALGRKLGVPAVHLDQLHHLPNTNWVQRPDEDFRRLQSEAVGADAWVMDGNYQRTFPLRFPRATGIILLRSNRIGSFARYLRRTLFERQRAGQLEGGKDRLNWNMVYWVLVYGPRNVAGYHDMFSATGLPLIELEGMAALKKLYATWGLSRG